MQFRSFLRYLLIPVYRPVQSLRALLADSRRVAYAVFALLLMGVLYTFTVYVGYTRGFGAVTAPFLNIPVEEYYYWETFFTIPVFFLSVIVFAGVGHLLALLFGGRGSFENIFAIYGLAMVLPTVLTMWLPETTLMVFFPDLRLMPLGGFSVFPMWVDTLRQAIGGMWPMVVAVIGIRLSEELNWAQSIVVALLAAVPTIVMILVFVR